MTPQDSLQITICSSFVVKQLKDYIIYWSNELELNIEVTIAPYNQVFQQLLNPDSLINQNKGISVLFIRVEDWLRDQKGKSVSEQTYFLNETYLEFIEAIQTARRFTNKSFLIAIVPLSSSNIFSQEILDLIINLNLKLKSDLEDLSWHYLIDLSKISRLYDIEEMFDSKSDEIAHIPFTNEFYAAIGTFITRKVRAYKIPSYKVIAIGCDNILWKGLCRDDGFSKIIIDKNYSYLQDFLLEKYNEGFLLVLCTNNNESDVWKVFEHHTKMKLRPEHFAAYRINTEATSVNLISIARELNLGLENFIFLHNDPKTEAFINNPEIFSVTLPEDADNFFDFLNHTWQFDTFHVTEEDRERNKMYQAEKERKQEQANFTHFNDFLKSLNIQINLKPLQKKDLDRAIQLTLRTNQFNLNGIRKTGEEISKVIHQPDSLNWIVDVKDRFGDYGIVGLLLAREINSTLVIDTFVLSCRTLGKNVEDFILTQLKKYCVTKGLNTISTNFIATPRNNYFFEFLGRTDWEPYLQTNTYTILTKERQTLVLVNEK